MDNIYYIVITFSDALDLRSPDDSEVDHRRYFIGHPPRPFPITDSSTAAVPTKQHSPTLSIEQRLVDLTTPRRHPGVPVAATTAGSPLPGRPASADVPSVPSMPLTLSVPKVHHHPGSPRLRPELLPLSLGDSGAGKHMSGYRFQGEISSYDIPSPPSNGKHLLHLTRLEEEKKHKKRF